MAKAPNAKQQEMNDDLRDELEEAPMQLKPRIQLLKERAAKLGISYSPNIGVDTLAQRIDDFLNGKVDEDAKLDMELSAGLPDTLSISELREAAHKLVRIVVIPADPMKIQMLGEFVWSGNSHLPTMGKFIPFNAVRGYHVPDILYQILKDRKYTAFRFRKDAYNNDIPYAVQLPAYSIQVLPPLTQKQIDKIAERQAASRRWDEDADDYNVDAEEV